LGWYWSLEELEAAARADVALEDVAVFGVSSGTAPRSGYEREFNVYYQFFVGPVGRWREIVRAYGDEGPSIKPGDV
jgi:hypothetical protein